MKKVKNNETGTVEWILELLKEMGVVYVDDIRHYKFRAECEHDVNELRMELGRRCVKIVKTVEYYFPRTFPNPRHPGNPNPYAAILHFANCTLHSIQLNLHYMIV